MSDAYLTFHPGNDQSLELDDMRATDMVTLAQAYLGPSANVRVTVVRKSDGSLVIGLDDAAMTYRTGANGQFYRSLQGDELDVGTEQYEVIFHGDDGAGSTFRITLPLKVRVRRSGTPIAAA